jgi:hypothetical protein
MAPRNVHVASEERKLAREMRKADRYKGSATALAHRVEQHSDEWGAP